MPDPDDAVPPYVLDDQIGFLLRLANQRHTAIFQKQMLQFSAMVRLLEIGECSQNELGRQVGMDIATTKGVVDRLRAKGLIDARPDPSDKRRALLSVAEEHLGLRAPLHAAGHAITDATLAPLSKAERAKLLQLIRKLT